MIKIISVGNNNKIIIELGKKDLELITGTNEEFKAQQELEVGSKLNTLHQLTRKKDKYVEGLQALSTILNTL